MCPQTRSFVSLILFIVLLVACGEAPKTAVVTPAALPAVTRLPIQATESVFRASLSEITGGVLAREARETSFSQAKDGYVVQILGQVQTQSDGRTRLDFSTGTLIRLGPSTLFTLQPPEEDSKGLLVRVRLEVGRLWVILQGGSLEVETKSGVAAVRGSYMSVSYDPDSGEARITCLEGNCSLSTPGGSVQITAGQTAVVTGAGQPPQVGDMDDQDVQDWLNNNPEATVVLPAQTEAPVSTEIPVATKIPPTAIVPPPPVFVNPPKPTKTEKPSEPDEPQPTATQAVQPTTTPTGTGTTTPPVLFQPVIEITGVTSAPVAGQTAGIEINVYPDINNGPIPTGTVWVMSGGSTLCTATLDVDGYALCSFTPGAGNYILDVHYSGDSQNYAAFSTTTPWVLFVSKAITTTTVTSQSPNPSSISGGNTVSFTAKVDVIPPGAFLPTGIVTFSDIYGDVCSADYASSWTCSVSFTNIISTPGPGFYTIIAAYGGDSNLNVSSTAVTQDIGP